MSDRADYPIPPFRCQRQMCSEPATYGVRVGRRDGGMYVEPRCDRHTAESVPVSCTTIVRLVPLQAVEAVELAHGAGVLMFEERRALSDTQHEEGAP